MNKLLIITVLVTLIALSAESFRLPRQALEEKTDILTKVIDRIKSCYEAIPGGNLRLKAGALVDDAMIVWGMYMSMIQEHIYNLLYPRQ